MRGSLGLMKWQVSAQVHRFFKANPVLVAFSCFLDEVTYLTLYPLFFLKFGV